jgi:HAD superfamily hydrolase (TIGR01509 family)
LAAVVTDTSDWQLGIFYCDGVLVDSEEITHRVLIGALTEIGLDLGLEEAMDLFMGNSLVQTIAIIEDRLGRALPENFFPQWRERLYRTLHEIPVRAVPGVEDVVLGLNIPVCVVSNGPYKKMETTLSVTGLMRHFEGRLFSSESGLPGKPAPDLFLAAAEAHAALPGKTFVVEDSAKGVAGAIAAGMVVFGYAGAAHTDPDSLAREGARVFSDMRDLPALLAVR